jgi:hypothetical protein
VRTAPLYFDPLRDRHTRKGAAAERTLLMTLESYPFSSTAAIKNGAGERGYDLYGKIR